MIYQLSYHLGDNDDGKLLLQYIRKFDSCMIFDNTWFIYSNENISIEELNHSIIELIGPQTLFIIFELPNKIEGLVPESVSKYYNNKIKQL